MALKLSNVFDFFLNYVDFSCSFVYLSKDKNMLRNVYLSLCIHWYIHMGECAYLGLYMFLYSLSTYMHISW